MGVNRKGVTSMTTRNTNQIIEEALAMTKSEEIEFRTQITSYMYLHISMNNNPLEVVNAFLWIDDIDNMSSIIQVKASYIVDIPVNTSNNLEVQKAFTVQSHELKLNIYDVIKLFRLNNETQWEFTNHGTMLF